MLIVQFLFPFTGYKYLAWEKGTVVCINNNNKLYLPPLAIELQWYYKPISNRQYNKKKSSKN